MLQGDRYKDNKKLQILFEYMYTYYIPVAILRVIHILTHLLPLSTGVCTMSNPILQMDRLRDRKVK